MGGASAPDRGLSLLTPDEMAAADQATIAAGTSGLTLMETAGARIARAVVARFHPCPVLVAAGPGNNGGDGFVVARLLAEAGWPVRLALLGRREALTGDAAAVAARWPDPVLPPDPDALDGADLVVDALFGAGLARPLGGSAARLVEAVAASPAPVVAVDLPSGVCGRTGAVLGVAAPAALTVTFFRGKPGHWLLPGRTLAGELVVADIGIGENVLDPAGTPLVLNHPALWQDRLPRPGVEDHKYSRGRVLVRAGAMPGAARLAAAAARRAGAGLLVMAAAPAAQAGLAADAPGLILADAADWPQLLADRRTRAALVGPGGGLAIDTLAATEAAVAAGVPVVLDADALTLLAEAGRRDIAREARAPVVLTPHDGEFARLFGDIDGTGRVERARAAAAASGAVIVLKGPDTVIATPDGRAAINANAPPTLATAGTGDVLAGLVLALLGQAMPAADAAAAAVWLHGAAAGRLGGRLIAEDLPRAVASVLDDLAPVGRSPGAPTIPTVVDSFRLS